jgi:hypothetical protein
MVGHADVATVPERIHAKAWAINYRSGFYRDCHLAGSRRGSCSVVEAINSVGL